jgi:hypothetical protein
MNKFHIVTKVAIGAFVFCALAVTLILIFAPQTATPKISDHDAFLNFYRVVMAACGPLDSTYKPLSVAMGKQAWLEAAIIAKQIKDPMNQGWYNLTLIKVPDLQNVEAKKELESAKERIDLSYYHKNQIIEKYLELIKNPEGAIDTGSDIIHSAERVKELLWGGILSMHVVGEKVGVTIEEMKAK